MAKSNKGNLAKKVLIGAGIAAGAGLAAYLLSSPKTRKKVQLKVKGWMRDMQKEVADRVNAMQEVTQQKYEQVVDEVKPKYKALKDVSGAELDTFSGEMKAHWDNISNAMKKKPKKAKRKK